MEHTPQPTDFISYYKSLNMLEREQLSKNGVTKGQLLELREAMGLSLQQISELMGNYRPNTVLEKRKRPA